MIGKKAEFAIFLERNEEAEQRKGKEKKTGASTNLRVHIYVCIYEKG